MSTLSPPPTASPTRLEQLTASLEEVRVARPAAVHVLGVVDDPHADAPKVAAAIELDPSLTAQIMRLANSAFYGMSGRVGNTSFAVTVIGFSAIRSLAALNATGLDDPATPRPTGFWAHAAATAAGCSIVANQFGVPRNDAFAAGLLHDLGGALLHRFDRDAHQRLLTEFGGDSLGLRDAEIRTFGIGHDAAAAQVLGAWCFPEPFVFAVERHHEASACASDFDHVVAAGNSLAELATTFHTAVLEPRYADDLEPDDDEFEPAGFERSIEQPGFEREEPAAPQTIDEDPSTADAGRRQHLDVLAAVGIDASTIDELVARTARRAAEIAATLPAH